MYLDLICPVIKIHVTGTTPKCIQPWNKNVFIVFIFVFIQLSETEAAPTREDMDTTRRHLQKGLLVCTCQSGVSSAQEVLYAQFSSLFNFQVKLLNTSHDSLHLELTGI